MKILLHTCCAPCLIYPLAQLRKKGFKVSGFFYNPNIHPFTEYQKRQSALGDYNKDINMDIDYSEYVPAEFFQALQLKVDKPQRCLVCWQLRLKKTAVFAKEKGFDTFSTTLLASPYQDHNLLKECGRQVAVDAGLDFYYEDFRVGFKQAQAEARARGIYRQKYCGCKFSI